MKKYRLKCYFAHPYTYKDTEDKYRILEELISRRLEVVDPFKKEAQILEEYGNPEFPGEYYELARRIWTKDLGEISSSQIVVAWIPSLEHEKSADLPYQTIGTAMEIAEAYNRGKFIQVISPVHHPSFAVYADQYFETINDFIWLKPYKWRKYNVDTA